MKCPVCGKEVSWSDDQVYLAGVFYHYECFKNQSKEVINNKHYFQKKY
jgi:hypothetical protein